MKAKKAMPAQKAKKAVVKKAMPAQKAKKKVATKKVVTEKDVRSALAELGKSLTEVCATLKKKKIKGTAGDGEDCPIAMYLKKKFSPSYIDVGGDLVTMRFNAGEDDEYEVEVSLNKTLQRFIEKVDDEAYPQLVE